MTKKSRMFPLGVLLSISSGRLLCSFSDMHECVEFLVGEPVFTHQFAFKPFADEIAASILEQHPALRAFDASAVTRENWRSCLADAERKFGKTLAVHPQRAKHIGASFTEPLRGKKVLVVDVD